MASVRLHSKSLRCVFTRGARAPTIDELRTCLRRGAGVAEPELSPGMARYCPLLHPPLTHQGSPPLRLRRNAWPAVPAREPHGVPLARLQPPPPSPPILTSSSPPRLPGSAAVAGRELEPRALVLCPAVQVGGMARRSEKASRLALRLLRSSATYPVVWLNFTPWHGRLHTPAAHPSATSNVRAVRRCGGSVEPLHGLAAVALFPPTTGGAMVSCPLLSALAQLPLAAPQVFGALGA